MMPTSDEIKETAWKMVQKNKDLFLLSTVDADGRPHTRYMGAMLMAGDFEVLMATHQGSRKVEHIKNNPNAQLVFSSDDYSRVVTLSGTARLGAPLDIKRRMWEAFPGLKQHFRDFTSPEFCVIRFKASALEIVTATSRYEPMRIEL
ncbi:MAG: pyridoxamine 5'-phosphate oxidase family protein [Planctomycetota bacterium]